MAKKKKIKQDMSEEAIRSKYPGSGLASIIAPDQDELFWVPTSSPVLNYRLGGGAAYGRIIELAGKESSGKSLLALDIIRNAQDMGGVGVFIDAEFAFSKSWASLNGVDPEALFLYEENTIELIGDFVAEISILYRSQLVANEPIVLVIDSVAALDTQAAMEASETDAKAEMGNRAKAFYKLLRIRNRLWAKLGITVVVINQLRDRINTGFGAQYKEKVTTVGGNAMKFYASQRIYLEAKKQLDKGSSKSKHRYGVEVEVVMKKNKLAIPRSPARIPVIFDAESDPENRELGFSRFHGLLDILLKIGTINKSGNAYYFDGDQLATSRVIMEEKLVEDEDLLEDVLTDAGIMTTEQMIIRLDEEPDNLYPISSVVFESYKDAKDEDKEGENADD